ncbi:MAG: GNAT family N-acetyltransferase [Bacillus sp. (in: firmicutes)]
MVIRKAIKEDAYSIAKVHVESWKQTYKGIISDKILSKLTVDKRAELWEKSLGDPENEVIVYVAENEKGCVIGFASGGINRSFENEFQGELHAIYLLNQYHGNKIGYNLFKNIIIELYNKDIKSLKVWVLTDNPSITFYEKLGGKPIEKKHIKFGNDHLEAIALGWKNINCILN